MLLPIPSALVLVPRLGGAFIAVADDATAASWNPGGLIQLERPEFSIVGSYTYRKRNLTSSSHPEADSSNSISRYDLNYLSCAYPFRAFDKNMVVSVNYQRLYDFYDKLDFDYDFEGRYSDSSFFKVQTTTRFRQSGALKALAPAFAVQITPRFSLGLTVNFWTDNLGYDNGYRTWERKITHTLQFIRRQDSLRSTAMNQSPGRKTKILKGLTPI